MKIAHPSILASVAALAFVASAATAKPSETDLPADVVARNVRVLVRMPSNVNVLIASGRAALELGDSAAAAGFFGRARELAPNNPAAHSGIASSLVALNQPAAALAELTRARELGADPASLSLDLGLAYDLSGDAAKAQAAYKAALSGRYEDEARRRLALSLAIGGDRSAGLLALEPLLKAGDGGALRTRAFILALGGDIAASRAALNEITSGSGSAAEPFLRELASLTAPEKAATLYLGIFPTRFGGIAAAAGGPENDGSPDEAFAAGDGTIVEPMEYGGPPTRQPSTNSRSSVRSALALYGVFSEP